MLQVVCWLLPASRAKNWLLRRFGHDIAASARIGPNLVWGVQHAEVGDFARIDPFNVVRSVRQLQMRRYAMIASFNWISAHPVYRQYDDVAGTLFLGTSARLGSRCYVDCSGAVVVRAFGAVGGNKCLLQTHAPDFQNDQQTIGRITVGHHALVGTRAVMLKGAFLPDQSVLAANSTLVGVKAGEVPKPGLYAGSPAVWKRATDGDWHRRTTYRTDGVVIDGPLCLQPEDLAPEDTEVMVPGRPGPSPF